MQAKAAHVQGTTPGVRFAWPPLAGFKSSEPPVAGAEPATWLNADLRSGLERTVLEKLGTNPFDRDALAAAHEAVAGTGWVRDDLRLARDADGVVRVTGTWRVPAAAVRFENQDRLVTGGGELLPVAYRPDASGYRVLLGASERPPANGALWLGGDVQAGLRLLAALAGVPGAEQIAAVDVGDFSSSRSLVLVTDVGNRIIWGGPVDAFNPGQATAEAKLQRLATLYRERGRVDAGRAVIDVRLIDGVYIQDTARVMARAGELMEAARGKGSNKKKASRQ